jgi:hypothetical protein
VKAQHLLASLCLGLGAACSGDVEASRPLGSQLAPRCVLTEEASLDPWALTWEDFARHNATHGWGATPHEVDLVSATTGARCPEEILDRIVAGQRSSAERASSVEVAVELARILARNDREESALALLDRVLSATYEDRDGPSSSASECAAQIAVDAGRWQQAIAYQEGWIPPTGCGNCEGIVKTRKQWVCARALRALGRHAELVELCRSSLDSEFTCNLQLIELWIDTEIQQGRASDSAQAMANILSAVEPGVRGFCSLALETWKLARAPREEQIEHLVDLAEWHRELAVPLVLTLTRAELQRHLWVFEVVDGKLRSSGQAAIALARVLAQLGLPDVGPALERARTQCSTEHVGTVDDLIDTWHKGNKRWNLLTGKER